MRSDLSRRVIEPELLENAPPELVRANLADLARINRYLGGHAIVRRVFQRIVHRAERFSVLDVGSASGDTSRMIRSGYPGARVVSLDLRWINLERAPSPRVIADAFAVPFADKSFDFVTSSLFLHHFTNEQSVVLLRKFERIARRAVLVFDLERHILPLLFLSVSKVLFGWSPITLHDGTISIRAAYRADELKRVAQLAGLRDLTIEVHRPAFRISLIARAGKEKRR